MSDGHVAYRALSTRNGGIVRCLCWIHGRRLLIKSFIGSDYEFNARMAKGNGPKGLEDLDIYKLDDVDDGQKVSLWGWICLLIIAEMFRIGKGLKGLDPAQRLARRNKDMKPLAEEFFKLVHLVKEKPQALANSYAKEAVSYFDNNKDALQKIFEDGRVPLGNNASERAAISLAIGRNAWKAHDTVEGARTTALMYSLVETAKANGASPYVYMKFLLESIQDVWHLHEAELLESDRFERKKRARLEAALERLREHPGSDPELDMRDLGEEPDLSFLECLMPWSEEFKGYCRIQSGRAAKLLADAVTKDCLGKMPVTADALGRILRSKGGEERTKLVGIACAIPLNPSKPGGSPRRCLGVDMVREKLKEAASGMEPMPAAEEPPSGTGSPAKDVLIPNERKPFCFKKGGGADPPAMDGGGGKPREGAGGHGLSGCGGDAGPASGEEGKAGNRERGPDNGGNPGHAGQALPRMPMSCAMQDDPGHGGQAPREARGKKARLPLPIWKKSRSREHVPPGPGRGGRQPAG